VSELPNIFTLTKNRSQETFGIDMSDMPFIISNSRKFLTLVDSDQRAALTAREHNINKNLAR
jgi:hypothetical protein